MGPRTIAARGAFLVLVVALAAPASAEELTVKEVIAAQRAGAPLEGILRLVREAPDVAALGGSDLDRMRAAGVPDAVIRAMAARHAPPTPTPTPPGSKPDDPGLENVVRLVVAGLSERLVCEQIRQSGERRTMSANDLVYLKEHGVPEEVIATLMESGARATPTPVPAPVAPSLVTPTPRPSPPLAVALVFEPLVRLTGTFRKARVGRLVLTEGDLAWSDAADPARVARTPVASLNAVWLSTSRPSQGPPLVELRVRTSAGEDVTFRDVDYAAGGSARVGALYQAIRERRPEAVVPDNPVR